MKVKVLASGSRGNATLLWAGGATLLVDAGLAIRDLTDRLERAGVGFKGLDHILVSHGHLDHARSAGILARRHGATLHCPEAIQGHRAVARAKDKRVLSERSPTVLDLPDGTRLSVTCTRVPHDCDPTFAFRFEHGGRVLAYLTDMGAPREHVGAALQGAHALLIEANHDVDLLRQGPYPAALKQRVLGDGGHLSNEQMQVMLARLSSPDLHTVILMHLSETNNRPELARGAATAALRGLDGVHVEVATQGAPLEVCSV